MLIPEKALKEKEGFHWINKPRQFVDVGSGIRFIKYKGSLNSAILETGHINKKTLLWEIDYVFGLDKKEYMKLVEIIKEAKEE